MRSTQVFYIFSLLFFVFPSICLEKTCAGQDAKFLEIQVVDEDGEPAHDASIRVWGIDKHATQSIPAKSDLEGMYSLKLPNWNQQDLCITVRLPEKKLAGCLEIPRSDFDSKRTYVIQLKPHLEFGLQMVDYHTGLPIDGGSIHAQFVSSRLGVLTESWTLETTDELETHLLTNLMPNGMAVRLRGEHPNYESFGRKAKGFQYITSINNGVEGPYQLEVISIANYRRLLDAARLSMPDVEGVSADEAWKVLAETHDRQKFRLEKSAIRHDSSKISTVHAITGYLHSTPTAFYRNAIWELIDEIRDDENRWQALNWLLNSAEYGYCPFDSVEHAAVTAKIGDLFAMHPEVSKVLLFIRSFHFEAAKTLQHIADEHDDGLTRALALEQLVYLYSFPDQRYYRRALKIQSKTEILDCVRLQEKRRGVLNQMAEQFGDLHLRNDSNETVSAWARERLAWIDHYGVNATAPNFNINPVGEDNPISLEDFRDKVVVLHFLRNNKKDTFADLSSLHDQHGSRIQIITIAIGEEPKVAKRVEPLKLAWPVIADPYQGNIVIDGDVVHGDEGPNWGDEKIGRFRKYGTFVIDQQGVISGAGLRDDELAKVVQDLLDRE